MRTDNETSIQNLTLPIYLIDILRTQHQYNPTIMPNDSEMIACVHLSFAPCRASIISDSERAIIAYRKSQAGIDKCDIPPVTIQKIRWQTGVVAASRACG